MNEIKLEDLDVFSLNHVNSHSKDNGIFYIPKLFIFYYKIFNYKI